MLPGVHRVRASLAGARVAEYWYAWRGGPRILAVKARSDDELGRLVEAAAAEAAATYKQLVTPTAAENHISGLVQKYLESAEYKRLGDRTRRDLRKHLDLVRAELGEMPLKALEAPRARHVLIEWRDKYKATPKTADDHLSALALVIGWAKKRGELTQHPLEKWPRLYRVDRADMVWTKADLIKLLKGADPDFRRAVLMAAFTGLRLGDLVGVTWADVGEKAITLATNKSRGRRVVVVPITPRLRAILAQIRRKDVGAVLTHSKGRPWTPEGLQTAMHRYKVRAGIKGLRLHDLRGTAATNFVRAGLSMVDVATIMGWTPNKVEGIARRYVTSEAVAAGMLERLGLARAVNGR
jgi:integrase